MDLDELLLFFEDIERMRMMHMGLDAYVVGETVTPNLEEGDLLIISTGSGETKSLVPMAEKAKELGATVAAVTIKPDSTS